MQRDGPRLDPPHDLAGRRSLVFDKAEGEENVRWELSPDDKVSANVMCLPSSFELLALVSSLESSSYSDSPYPCIIVQLQSPARLRRTLTP